MNVGVYGLGRFGSLWASILAERHTVLGFNRSQRPVPDCVRRVDEEDLAECDVVFLCVAIRAVEPVCRRLSEILAPGTLVVDTCSVKVHPVETMKRVLPDAVEVLGSHPMFGPDSLGGDRSRLPVVLSEGRNSAETFSFWQSELEALGFTVRPMTADDHDREAARTQGVTHLVGRILEQLHLTESDISTVGYRRILQVMEQTCNDPVDLFVDLWRFNPHAEEMLSRFRNAWERTLEKLDSEHFEQ